MHSHLSTAQKDKGFAVEMIAKCTKLKVLGFLAHHDILFSTRLFLNVFNTSTSLQTLSLDGVKLSDMVSPP